MKKYFVFGILVAAALVSCKKEALVESSSSIISGKGSSTLFNAGFEETKTYLDGSLTPLWGDDDKLVVNGIVSTDNVPASDRKSISFKVEGVESPYCVLSPATLFDTSNDCAFDSGSGKMTVMIPGTGRMQRYAEGTYSPEGAIAAAYSTDESCIKLKSLSVFLRIKLTEGTDADNISKVLIHQGDGSGIAGKWDITYSPSGISMAPTAVSAPVGYWCGPEGVAQGTEMLVGIPAYNYANGLIISVQDVNDHFCNFTIADADFSGKGGHIIPVEMAFSPKGTFDVGTEEEWNAMAKQLNCLYQKANCDINITADITAQKLDKIAKNFAGTLNGNNKTIKKTASEANLFRSISGTVKDLTLDGEMNAQIQNISGMADSLHNGGVIKDVTTKMNITGSYENGYIMMGGLVRVVAGGTIEGCTNEGNLTLNLDFTNYSGKSDAHRVLGGIACQVNNGDNPVVISGCNNTGELIVNPIYETIGQANGLGVSALGGIVGWVRSSKASLKFENCTNEGSLNFKADNIQSTTGPAAVSVNVGGIAGLAAPVGLGKYDTGRLSYPSGTNGMLVEFSGCINRGIINNDGISYSDGKEIDTNSYAGGIVGTVAGNSNAYAKLSECENTGAVYSYSKCIDGTASYDKASMRPGYCCVLGGLAGCAGFVEADNCLVNCELGNGKRPVMAIAGAFGIAVRPFKVSESSIYFKGYFTRFDKYKDNRSIIATVPLECLIESGSVIHTDPGNYSKDSDTRIRFGASSIAGVPDIAGSTITDCRVGASLRTSTKTIGWTKDKGYDQTLVTVDDANNGKLLYNATILTSESAIFSDTNNGCSLVHGQFFPKGKEASPQDAYYTYSNVIFWNGQ